MNRIASDAFSEAATAMQKYRVYNGFYQRQDVRKVVAELYRNKCAITGDDIGFEDGEVGHIVPRARPKIFSDLYPGLDIDNVVNLHWIKKSLNRRNSAAVNPSPLAVASQIAYACEIIDGRLNAIEKRLMSPPSAKKKKPLKTVGQANRKGRNVESALNRMGFKDLSLIQACKNGQDICKVDVREPFDALNQKQAAHIMMDIFRRHENENSLMLVSEDEKNVIQHLSSVGVVILHSGIIAMWAISNCSIVSNFSSQENLAEFRMSPFIPLIVKSNPSAFLNGGEFILPDGIKYESEERVFDLSKVLRSRVELVQPVFG